MTKNMGILDRTARILLAVTAAGLYFTGMISGVLAAVLGGLSLVFIVTSVVGTCPLYNALGLDTRRST